MNNLDMSSRIRNYAFQQFILLNGINWLNNQNFHIDFILRRMAERWTVNNNSAQLDSGQNGSSISCTGFGRLTMISCDRQTEVEIIFLALDSISFYSTCKQNDDKNLRPFAKIERGKNRVLKSNPRRRSSFHSMESIRIFSMTQFLDDPMIEDLLNLPESSDN